MYSELLRVALASASEDGERDVEALAQRLRAQRRALGLGAHTSAGGDTMERITDLLAHDVLVVELCQRLGIEEHLTDPQGGPSGPERDRLLERLRTDGVGVDEQTAQSAAHPAD
jgi:hypothetical protein